MEGTIASVMSPVRVAAKPTDSLRDAARAMLAGGTHLALVPDAASGPGVLTASDVIVAVAAGVDLDAEWVADHMTRARVLVAPESALAAAARRMVDAGVRHLLVDRGGRVVGVVSMWDLLPWAGARDDSPAPPPEGKATS